MHKLSGLGFVLGAFLTFNNYASEVGGDHLAPVTKRSSHTLEFSGKPLIFYKVDKYATCLRVRRSFGAAANVCLYSLNRRLANECAIPTGEIYFRFKPDAAAGDCKISILSMGWQDRLEQLPKVVDYQYYRVKCHQPEDPVELAAQLQQKHHRVIAFAEPDFCGDFKD